jgi:molybdate transport system regulatory protein
MNSVTAKPSLTRPRILLGPQLLMGPGKIDLLVAIDQTGSISAAARKIGMSYKRAWDLVNSLSTDLGTPMLSSSVGGKGGGGAQLTECARAIIEAYQRLVEAINTAAEAPLAAMQELVDRHRTG